MAMPLRPQIALDAASIAAETCGAHAPGGDTGLASIPARDRLIVQLFHLDGATYRQIAAVLAIPLNAVSPALSLAREKLRVLFPKGR